MRYTHSSTNIQDVGKEGRNSKQGRSSKLQALPSHHWTTGSPPTTGSRGVHTGTLLHTVCNTPDIMLHLKLRCDGRIALEEIQEVTAHLNVSLIKVMFVPLLYKCCLLR